ncbi:MAG TPA: BlaI/MecI/CopY family transcriptional regulator [Solirubrobacterales bacterium]|nr:BlaI/MecI/CopY family transcriptional regulator [Solirubrobacterales bacterium]
MRGDLQAEIMTAVWKLGEATVEQVRSELPADGRPAYNTVQTVLNRLEARKMLVRTKNGRAHVYEPSLNESEFVTRSLGERLAEASPDARRLALLNLVDALEPGEVDEIAERARQIQARRGSPE